MMAKPTVTAYDDDENPNHNEGGGADEDEEDSTSEYSSGSSSSFDNPATDTRRLDLFNAQIEELKDHYRSDEFKAPTHYLPPTLTMDYGAFHTDWVEKMDRGIAVANHKPNGYLSVRDLIHNSPASEDGNSEWVNEIVIHSPMGTGRTALVKWLAREWALGKIWPFFNIVFVVQFSQLCKTKNLFELYGFDSLEDLIWAQKERVLFIVDDFESVVRLANQYDSWVFNLFLKVQAFPNWIITTRTDYAHLVARGRKDVRRFALCLFTNSERSRFISNIFMRLEARSIQRDPDSIDLASNFAIEADLQTRLDGDGVLRSISYVPFIASALCKAYLNGIRDLSHLWVFVVARFFKRYFRKYMHVQMIVDSMDEAYELMENKLVGEITSAIRAFCFSVENFAIMNARTAAAASIYSSTSSTSLASSTSVKSATSASSASSSASSTVSSSHGSSTLRTILKTGLVTAWPVVGTDGKVEYKYQFIHRGIEGILTGTS